MSQLWTKGYFNQVKAESVGMNGTVLSLFILSYRGQVAADICQGLLGYFSGAPDLLHVPKQVLCWSGGRHETSVSRAETMAWGLQIANQQVIAAGALQCLKMGCMSGCSRIAG